MGFRDHGFRFFNNRPVLDRQINQSDQRIFKHGFSRKHRLPGCHHRILVQQRVHLRHDTFPPLLERIKFFKVHGKFRFRFRDVPLSSGPVRITRLGGTFEFFQEFFDLRKRIERSINKIEFVIKFGEFRGDVAFKGQIAGMGGFGFRLGGFSSFDQFRGKRHFLGNPEPVFFRTGHGFNH